MDIEKNIAEYTLKPHTIPVGYCRYCDKSVKITFAGWCNTCWRSKRIKPDRHLLIGYNKCWRDDGILYEQMMYDWRLAANPEILGDKVLVNRKLLRGGEER